MATVRPVDGGPPARVRGLGRGDDHLVLERGRLAAYDEHRVHVFDVRSGRLLSAAAAPMAARSPVRGYCAPSFCTYGEPSGRRASDTDDATTVHARPRVVDVATGAVAAIPGLPRVGGGGDGPSDAESPDVVIEAWVGPPAVHGRFVVWSDTDRTGHEVGYLYDTASHRLVHLGRGQVEVTPDGYLVVAPATDGTHPAHARTSLGIRYAKLPA